MTQPISKYGNKSRQAGWHNESARHSLAAKGIKTKINYAKLCSAKLHSSNANYAQKSELSFEPMYAKKAIKYENLSSEGQLHHLESEKEAFISKIEHHLKEGITLTQGLKLDHDMQDFGEKVVALTQRAEQEDNEKVESKSRYLFVLDIFVDDRLNEPYEKLKNRGYRGR